MKYYVLKQLNIDIKPNNETNGCAEISNTNYGLFNLLVGWHIPTEYPIFLTWHKLAQSSYQLTISQTSIDDILPSIY